MAAEPEDVLLDGPVPPLRVKTKRYIVEVAREVGEPAEDGSFDIWWEGCDEFDVPRRTNRRTVLLKAGELAASYMASAAASSVAPGTHEGPVEFRVLDADDLFGGKAELEVPPPRLKVTEL